MKGKIAKNKWLLTALLTALLLAATGLALSLGVSGENAAYADTYFTPTEFSVSNSAIADGWKIDGFDTIDSAWKNATADQKKNVQVKIPATYDKGGTTRNVVEISPSAFSSTQYNGYTITSLDLSGATHLKKIGDKAFNSRKTLTGALTIPETVETIVDYAFTQCTGISSLVFEGNSNLTAIGGNAFTQCTGLKTLTLPQKVETIGENAFSGCTGLTGSLTIPQSVKTIGNRAFSSCSGFDGTLTFADNSVLTEIGYGAFYECKFTGTLTIPASVTTIGSLAESETSAGARVFYGNSFDKLTFAENSQLETIGTNAFKDYAGFTGELKIPAKVTRIGAGAFRNCAGFTGALEIPAKVTQIGNRAFNGCTGLTSLAWAEGSALAIGDYAFSGCSNMAETLTIPARVTAIGSYAFSGCEGFTSLSFAEGSEALEIGSSAFSGCSNMAGALEIPARVTKIGNYAFEQRNTLTSLAFAAGSRLEEIGKAAFKSCAGFTGALALPAGVTTIGESAFEGCKGFDGALTLPAALTEIGSRTFYDCKFTGALEIPAHVTKIGQYAFYQIKNTGRFDGALTFAANSALTEIASGAFYECNFTGALEIPAGVQTIGALVGTSTSVFTSKGLTSLTFAGSALTTIGANAFKECSGFTGELKIPANVTAIGDSAFEGCNGFTSLTFAENSALTAIGDKAFSKCSAFACNLNLPDSVTTIGKSAFSGCEKLNGDLKLPAQLTTIAESAFSGCKGFDGTLTLPANVETIGSGAFYYCVGLQGSLTLPDSVKTLGNSVFYYCAGFTGELKIPAKVTQINYNAFNGCKGFTKLTFAENSALTTIGTDAFKDCSGLGEDLQIPANVTTIDEGAFKACRGFTGELKIPAKVTTIGQSAFNACGFTALTFAENSALTTIGENAFFNCLKFKGALTIPESVTKIGRQAFYCAGFDGTLTLPENSSFTKIETETFYKCGFTGALAIPSNVTTIGSSAFYGCAGLTSFNWDSTLTTLGSGAFQSSGLSGTLTIPSFVTKIDSSVFAGCTGLTGLAFAENSALTAIGDNAFSGCSGLGALTLPATVETIGKSAFSDCKGFTGELVIPAKVTTISQYAFYGCKGFTGQLEIPANVTQIGDNAFYGCEKFTSLTFAGSALTQIGSRAFFNCTGLANDLEIPDSVETIGASAFNGCSGFDGTLKLPKNMNFTEISDSTFFNCHFTGKLEIPASVTAIGSYAFESCAFSGELVLTAFVTTIGQNAFNQGSYGDHFNQVRFTGVGLTSPLKSNTFPSHVPVILKKATYERETASGGKFANCDATYEIEVNFYRNDEAQPIVQKKLYGMSFRYEQNAETGLWELGSQITFPVDIPQGHRAAGVFKEKTGGEPLDFATASVTQENYYCRTNEILPFTATYENGGFTITGFDTDYLALQPDKTKIAVVIPETFDDGTNSGPVKAIAANAFDQRKSEYADYTFFLLDLSAAKSLQTIGNNAFYFCTDFAGELVLPASLQTIGMTAFSGCTGFTGKLVIPAAVTKIDTLAFDGCTGLCQVEIPVVGLTEAVLKGTFPNGVPVILADKAAYDEQTAAGGMLNALPGATYETEITIRLDATGQSRSETKLYKQRFEYRKDSGLWKKGYTFADTFTTPAGRRVVGMFDMETAGRKVSLTTDVTQDTYYYRTEEIPPFTVQYENGGYTLTGLTQEFIQSWNGFGPMAFGVPAEYDGDHGPAPVLAIAAGAFAIDGHSYTIGTVDFSGAENLTTIGVRAFAGQPLVSLVIPASVLAIEEGAFVGCSTLNQVEIPKVGLTTAVPADTFPAVPIILADEAAYRAQIAGALANYAEQATYEIVVSFYREGAAAPYKIEQKLYNQAFSYEKEASGQWKNNTSYRLPAPQLGVGYKGLGLFAQETGGEALAITDAVLQSVYYHRSEKLSLFDVILANGECTITGFNHDYLATLADPNSTEIVISVEIEIVIPAFYNDGTTNYPVTAIGEGAFNKSNYGWISTENGNSFVSPAFTSLDLSAAENLVTIGKEAFSDCEFTGDLEISDSVVTIGDSAFQNCQCTGALIFGKNSKLQTLGMMAFSGSTIGRVILPASLKEIGSSFVVSTIGQIEWPEVNPAVTVDSNAFMGAATVVLVSKEVYEASQTEGGLLYDCKSYLAYETEVEFYLNGASAPYVTETKLFNNSFVYVKGADGIWKSDRNYTFPAPQVSDKYKDYGMFVSLEEGAGSVSTFDLVKQNAYYHIVEPVYTYIEASLQTGGGAEYGDAIGDLKGLVVKGYFSYDNDNYEILNAAAYKVSFQNSQQKTFVTGENVLLIETVAGYRTISRTTSFKIDASPKTLAAPSVTGTYTYQKGTAQTVQLTGFDGALMEIVSGNSYTDAGDYKVIVRLKDSANYQWTGGTTPNREISWKIAKLQIDKPAENTGTFTYNKSEQTYTLAASEWYTVKNNTRTDAGSQTVSVELTDSSTEWKNGGSDALTFTFTIGRLGVDKPTVTASTYTGSSLTTNIQTCDEYTVNGNHQTEANENGWEITVTVKSNYRWSDGDENDSITMKWIIHKADVTVSAGVTPDTRTVFVDGELPAISCVSSSVSGTIAWDDYQLSAPAKGAKFGWTFTPTDANNYNNATGEIVFDVLAVELAEITAEFTQGGVVYTSGSLDDLLGWLTVKGKNNDGSDYTGTINYTLSGTLTAGTAEITVTVKDTEISAAFNVTVTAVVLESITVGLQQGTIVVFTSTKIDDLKTILGEALTVTAKYNDGSQPAVTGFTLSGDLTVAGSATVTASFGGKTAAFSVKVTAVALAGITAEFAQGGAVYPSGRLEDLQKWLIVKGKNNDGSDYAGTIDYTLSGALTAGTAEITVTVKDTQISATFEVEVTAVALAEITAEFTQDGAVYTSGNLDALKDGLTVKGKNNDGSDYAGVIEYTLSGTLTAGTAEITVTVKDTRISATFEVEVTAVAVERIEVTAQPSKTVYTALETFERAGMAVTAFYNDGQHNIIEDYSVTQAPLTAGMTAVTISYTYNEKTVTATVAISVAKISLEKPGVSGTYVYNQSEQQVAVVGLTDKMTVVSGDKGTNADNYKLVVKLNDPVNYQWKDGDSENLTFDWSIGKATFDLKGISFTDVTVKEDGDKHTVTLTGTLPKGLSVTYTGGEKSEPGEYIVTATFTYDKNNYYDVQDMTANLTINKAQVVKQENVGEEHKETVVIESENGLAPNIVLDATDVTATEHGIVVEEKDTEIKQVYDIKLIKDGTAVQPDGNITIRLLIAENLRGESNLKVIHIAADGSKTDVNAMREGDYLVFTVSGLSKFAIIGDVRNTVSAGAIAATVVFWALALLGAAYIVYYYKKKGKGSGNEQGKKSVKTRSLAPLLLATFVPAGLTAALVIGILAFAGAAGYIVFLHCKDGSLPALLQSLKAKIFPPEKSAAQTVESGSEGAAEFSAAVSEGAAAIPAAVNESAAAANGTAAGSLAGMPFPAVFGPQEAGIKDEEPQTEKSDKAEATIEAAASVESETVASGEKEAAAGVENEIAASAVRAEKNFKLSGVVYHKSFLAKLIQGSGENKRYYDVLKNELLSYKKVRSSLSFTQEAFLLGRKRLAVVNISGKTLKLFLALDPENVEKKYAARNAGDKKKYAKTPCCIRIKSETGLRKMIFLIARLMQETGVEYESEYQRRDFSSAFPYEETESLIARGLIKKRVLGGDEAKKADISALIRQKITLTEAQNTISDEIAAALVENSHDLASRTVADFNALKKAVINIDSLSEHFGAHETVTLDALKEKGLIAKNVGFVKVLARGTLDKPLIVKAQDFSLDAVRMIALTGGKAVRTA